MSEYTRLHLYQNPEYYDIAFSGDSERELEKFRECFEYCEHNVEYVLEPACGTGRFLRILSRFGYNVVGYDISPEMARYAGRKMAEGGLRGSYSVFVGDMASVRFKSQVFDAAFNAVNGLGYLHSDTSIISHLVNTADALKQGGVYIVELILAWRDLPQFTACEGWVRSRDGITVTTKWDNIKEDHERRISFQMVDITAIDNGRRVTLREPHEYRLWRCQDFCRLVRQTGVLSLLAILSEDLTPINVESDPSGELGNLLFVLSKDASPSLPV